MSPSGVPGDRPSGTVTFLFTDVEGSTRLWAADKDAMSASLLVHDAILRGAIEGNGGYVFTTAGDSFAAAFGRASDAVRAATESQRALTDASWPGPALNVRMGLHLGEAEERGGDILTFLADKQALVILDNCEHLIDETATFVDAFLATNNPTKRFAAGGEDAPRRQ